MSEEVSGRDAPLPGGQGGPPDQSQGATDAASSAAGPAPPPGTATGPTAARSTPPPQAGAAGEQQQVGLQPHERLGRPSGARAGETGTKNVAFVPPNERVNPIGDINPLDEGQSLPVLPCAGLPAAHDEAVQVPRDAHTVQNGLQEVSAAPNPDIGAGNFPQNGGRTIKAELIDGQAELSQLPIRFSSPKIVL